MKRIGLKWFLLTLIISGNAFFAIGQNTETLKEWEFLKGDLGGIWEGIRHAPKGSQQWVPMWEKVSVPHCYNAFDAVNPDVNYYQGPAWYRTWIDPVITKDDRWVLHFEGVGQKSEVFVFDQKVGTHVGGYDEWSIDISKAIKAFAHHPYLEKYYKGRVPVFVRCDNSRDVEMMPSDLSDFNLYGGIYRPVHLRQLPAIHITQVKHMPVVDAAGKKATLSTHINIENNHAANYRLKVNVHDPKGKLVYSDEVNSTEKEVKFQFGLKRPKLWSPEIPYLYSCKVEIESEYGKQTVVEKTGFRHFEFIKNGPFKLNGKRLLLKGTHRHEDHAGVGAAMSTELMRQEMIMMKQMGVNFIRLGHYQQSREILHLCDSLGMLVWEEIPWCRGGLGGEHYREQGRRMLTNMIEQHYNHPSVIIWGLGNENDWPGDFSYFQKDSIRAYMKELHELSHQLDDSRKTAIRRCNFCKDIIDVYSPSIWAGWYRGKFTEYKEVSRMEMEEVDHFLHVEWGASNHAGRHSEDPDKGLDRIKTGSGADERDGDATMYGGAARVSKDGDWTETYACNLIDWHLKEQENMPWLTGTAYWPFKDFSTPVRPENPVPYVNQKGVVERDLTPKEAYYVFQSYWTEKPMAHIYGHSWPVRWGKEGEKKLVKVYSNCETAELFLNGVSLGRKKRNSQNYPAAGLRWNVEFKKGHNHLKVIARKDGVVVYDEINVDYETRKWGEPKSLHVSQKVLEDGQVEVEMVVKDENGVICLDSKNWVRFEYVGDGVLQADLGIATGARKVQMANGRAAIRIMQTKGKGMLRIVTKQVKPHYEWIISNNNLLDSSL